MNLNTSNYLHVLHDFTNNFQSELKLTTPEEKRKISSNPNDTKKPSQNKKLSIYIKTANIHRIDLPTLLKIENNSKISQEISVDKALKKFHEILLRPEIKTLINVRKSLLNNPSELRLSDFAQLWEIIKDYDRNNSNRDENPDLLKGKDFTLYDIREKVLDAFKPY